MTDRYVGRDLELLDLIATEKQEELGHALDELLGTDCLAGKLGEQIVTRNQRFRGRAGEQVRREYVKMVLEETDLVILPHEYGTVSTVPRSRVVQAPGHVWGYRHALAARTSRSDPHTSRTGSAAATMRLT